MSEIEENGGARFDGWRDMDSSPKDLVPEFVSDEFAPTPMTEAPIVEKVDGSELSSDMKCEGGGEAMIEASSDWNCAAVKNEESIAERRAAKCGFNAVRINTARFKCTSPLSSPSACSPRLTFPDGISPTALLDSPVMLPNTQAQPSPTTGSFTLPTLSHESSILNSVASTVDGDKGNGVGSFRFKPHRSHVNLQLQSDLEIQPLMEFALQTKSSEAVAKNCATKSSDAKVSEHMILNSNCLPLQSCHPRLAGDQMAQFKEPVYGEDSGAHNLLEGDQKGTYHAMGMARTSEDGYSWRKYGQKQVKGSEYPRSYYKCTHPNCQVKKKVERSHDGQITEIIYKGTHNHPKPQPNRRSVLGSPFSFNEMSDMCEGNRSCGKVEGGVVWRNIQLGSKDIKVGADWRTDGSERMSSGSVVTEISEPFLTTQGKSMGIFESVGTPELSSTLASNDDDDNDDDEDGTTQKNISLGDDAADEENELKRRKKDNCLNETNLASRAVREPRVVVEIESEVDILDDGYRWRKYGQKVVKGNPNPRSYYKCTSAGCSVRKHVERASQDLKFIVTTYEGKHNHEVPAARNGSHVNSGGGNLSLAASNTQPPLALPRSVNIPKPDTQAQDLALCFETKSELGNEFMRSNLLGNFDNSIKFGASSFYQMKFPSVQSTIPYGSFVLNPNQGETQPASSITSVVPDFPMSLPLTNSRPTNMAMAELDFNNHGKPVGSVRSFLGGEQLRESDVMLLKPKQEQKDDSLSDTHLPFVELASGSSSSTSSSVYCQIMGSFPS